MGWRNVRAEDERRMRAEDVEWGLREGDPVVCWVDGLPLFRSRLVRRNAALEAELSVVRWCQAQSLPQGFTAVDGGWMAPDGYTGE